MNKTSTDALPTSLRLCAEGITNAEQLNRALTAGLADFASGKITRQQAHFILTFTARLRNLYNAPTSPVAV
jgi:hypothetical protein